MGFCCAGVESDDAKDCEQSKSKAGLGQSAFKQEAPKLCRCHAWPHVVQRFAAC